MRGTDVPPPAILNGGSTVLRDNPLLSDPAIAPKITPDSFKERVRRDILEREERIAKLLDQYRERVAYGEMSDQEREALIEQIGDLINRNEHRRSFDLGEKIEGNPGHRDGTVQARQQLSRIDAGAKTDPKRQAIKGIISPTGAPVPLNRRD